jgi:hypothetical protein
MYLINGDSQPDQIFNYTVYNLCIGEVYELSIYLANIRIPSGAILPNVRFQVVDSATGTVVLAELATGDVPETDNMTWIHYGMQFTAPTTSVVLLIISNALEQGAGNDFVIDDLIFRSCSNVGMDQCI